MGLALEWLGATVPKWTQASSTNGETARRVMEDPAETDTQT